MLTRLLIGFLILLGYVPDWIVRKAKAVHRYLGWFGIFFMGFITPVLVAIAIAQHMWGTSIFCFVFALFLCNGEQEKNLKRKDARTRRWVARQAITELAAYTNLYQNPDPKLQDIVRRINAGLD